MKITKTFENATLRTVNHGYIELNYNGKTDCFHNASVISVNNGMITIEVDWEPKKGELIKVVGCNIDCYVIFNYINSGRSNSSNILYTYGSINKDFISIGYFKLDDDTWACDYHVQLLPVTPEEQQAFDDFCKSQGKIWNKEKLQWEKYKWRPKPNECYWCVASWGEVIYRPYLATRADQDLLQLGNAFPTKEQAQKVAEKVTQFFKSL